jgi:hypothetical protein
MSDTESGAPPAPEEEATLEDRLNALQAAYEGVVADLDVIGKAAVDRMNETEMAIAHVLALEAVLVELMKAHPIDPEAVKAGIKAKTAEISGNPDGSPLVLQAAQEILALAKG